LVSPGSKKLYAEDADKWREDAEMNVNEITGEVVDAAVKVHRRLGPGLLESAYRACLAFELRKRGLFVEEDLPVALEYDELRIEVAFRLDLLVEKCVIVECKATRRTIEEHEAQLLSHLRCSDLRVGLLINFHAVLLKKGIKRLVNRYHG
jgi:GxxExxY protein